MKKIICTLLLSFLFYAGFSQVFMPLSQPGHYDQGKYGLSIDSIVKSIRPVVVITANVSDGAQLAGGAGFGYQSNKWNAASQSYITQFSISAVGLLGTNGAKLTGTGGIIVGIPGTNGMIGIGGGYDFTQKQSVLIMGAQIKFN